MGCAGRCASTVLIACCAATMALRLAASSCAAVCRCAAACSLRSRPMSSWIAVRSAAPANATKCVGMC